MSEVDPELDTFSPNSQRGVTSSNCCRFDNNIMDLFSSLGAIAVGFGLATGANSEADILHDDDDDIEEERKVFVGGLPKDVRQDDLQEYFGRFGEMENVKLVKDSKNGRSLGYAFLLYKDVRSSKKVLENKDHKLKVIRIRRMAK